jgi:hypothetical protein
MEYYMRPKPRHELDNVSTPIREDIIKLIRELLLQEIKRDQAVKERIKVQ